MRVLYNPTLSEAGVLKCAARKPRAADPLDFQVWAERFTDSDLACHTCAALCLIRNTCWKQHPLRPSGPGYKWLSALHSGALPLVLDICRLSAPPCGMMRAYLLTCTIWPVCACLTATGVPLSAPWQVYKQNALSCNCIAYSHFSVCAIKKVSCTAWPAHPVIIVLFFLLCCKPLPTHVLSSTTFTADLRCCSCLQAPLVIHAPHALPMYRDDQHKRKRKSERDRDDAAKFRKPQAGQSAAQLGRGAGGNIGATGGTLLTQYVLKSQVSLLTATPHQMTSLSFSYSSDSKASESEATPMKAPQ